MKKCMFKKKKKRRSVCLERRHIVLLKNNWGFPRCFPAGGQQRKAPKHLNHWSQPMRTIQDTVQRSQSRLISLIRLRKGLMGTSLSLPVRLRDGRPVLGQCLQTRATQKRHTDQEVNIQDTHMDTSRLKTQQGALTQDDPVLYMTAQWTPWILKGHRDPV